MKKRIDSDVDDEKKEKCGGNGDFLLRSLYNMFLIITHFIQMSTPFCFKSVRRPDCRIPHCLMGTWPSTSFLRSCIIFKLKKSLLLNLKPLQILTLQIVSRRTHYLTTRKRKRPYYVIICSSRWCCFYHPSA
jgi:hypothetical protein